nr:hypothetical protein [Tanacetum cinerariifolium]
RRRAAGVGQRRHPCRAGPGPRRAIPGPASDRRYRVAPAGDPAAQGGTARPGHRAMSRHGAASELCSDLVG